jgi:hypothetical protein
MLINDTYYREIKFINEKYKKNEKQLRKWKDVQPINKCLNL